MPPRRKNVATARRGGRQAAAANLRVGTAADKDDKLEEVKSEEAKTPITAASEQIAQTDTKRSPTPEKPAEKVSDEASEKPVKIETLPPTKDEAEKTNADQPEIKDEPEKMDVDPPVAVKPESTATGETAKMENRLEAKDETAKMNVDPPVDTKPAPPTTNPSSNLLEDISTKSSLETEVPRGISRSESIKAAARKRSNAVSYPESDGETEPTGARAKFDRSGSQLDEEDMEVEQDGEPYLRERFSTERIRHTSPISARVLQNVRALKEEILNGSGGGLNGAPSYSSNLDEEFMTARQRSSSIIAPASTDISASTSFERPAMSTKEDDRARMEARKSRFSADNQSTNGSGNNALPDKRGQTSDAGVPEALAGKAPEIISGVKRAMDVARALGLDNPRNFKRQRNLSPARSWQGPGDAGRHQAQVPSRWQGNNRPDLYRPSENSADQHGNFRPPDGPGKPLQTNLGIPGRPLERAPPAGSSESNDGRVSQETRERERSPPRRHSRWDQPAPASTTGNWDRALQNESGRGMAGNGVQDARLDKRPFSSPPRPSRFSPATAQIQQASRTGASSYSPSGPLQPHIHPDRLHARDPSQLSSPAHTGNKAQAGSQSIASNPPARQPLALNPGPQHPDTGYSRNSQNERPAAVLDIPRDQSQHVKTDAPATHAVGQNRDIPRRPETFLPEKPRVSRFAAAPAGPANSGRGNWNAPTSNHLPSLTAANLGRNMQSLPESHRTAQKTVSRASDDGRSALSEARGATLDSPGTEGEPGRRRPPGSAALRAELDVRHQTQGAPRYRYIGHVDADDTASRESDRDLRNPSIPSVLPPSESSNMHLGVTSIRSSGNPGQVQEPYPAYDSLRNRTDARSFGRRDDTRNNFNALAQRQDVPAEPFRDNRDISLPRFTSGNRGDPPHVPPSHSGTIGRFDDRGLSNRQIGDSRALRQHEFDRPPSQDSFNRRVDRMPDHPSSLAYADRSIDNFAPAGRPERAAATSAYNPSTLSYAPVDERYRHEAVAIPRFTSSLVEQELAAMKQKIADLERLRALELSVYGAVPVVTAQRSASPPVRRTSNGYHDMREAGRFDATRDPPFRNNLESRDQGNVRGSLGMSGDQHFQAMRDSRQFQGGRDARDVHGPVTHMVPSHGPRYGDQANGMGPRNPVDGPGNGGIGPPRQATPTSLSGRAEGPRNLNLPRAMPPPSRMNDSRPPIRGREPMHEDRRMPERDVNSFDDRAPIRSSADGPYPGPGQPYSNVPPNQPWDRRNLAESRGGSTQAGNQNFRPGYAAQNAQNGRR